MNTKKNKPKLGFSWSISRFLWCKVFCLSFGGVAVTARGGSRNVANRKFYVKGRSFHSTNSLCTIYYNSFVNKSSPTVTTGEILQKKAQIWWVDLLKLSHFLARVESNKLVSTHYF